MQEENSQGAEEVQELPGDGMEETEVQQWPEDSEDASPLSEDSQLSEDRSDSEREEEILALLSSGASSPESESNDSNISVEGKRKRDADSSNAGRKRDKSLTEGISKKIFRSITGMKFNIKDTVASNDSENVSATDVKFLRYSPTPNTEKSNDGKLNDEKMEHNLERKEEKAEGNEERPGSRLRARDSILIQHRKMSPMLQRRVDSDENDDSYSDEEVHSKSFDSDVIDLTNIGDYDFDSDLSPTKSLPSGAGSEDGDDDVFGDEDKLLEEEKDDDDEEDFHDMQGIEELLKAVMPSTKQFNDALETDESKTLSVESDDDLDIPNIDEDTSEHMTEKCPEDQEHSRTGDEEHDVDIDNDDDVDDDDEIPISTIDSVSPEPDLRSPELLSDEAHGMQLAALVALDASLEDAEEAINAAAQCTYTECESDSGNETISSEIDSTNADHQPKDYVRFVMTPTLEQWQDVDMESKDRNGASMSEEDILEPYSGTGGCTTSSDTESTSTLHGSSPNLSAIDVGDEKVSLKPSKDIGAKALSPSEPSRDQTEQPGMVETHVDDIDALIATLIVPPPPLECGEIDEELLQAILPPPPMEGFDEGTIDNVFPRLSPHELNGESNADVDLPVSEVSSSGLMQEKEDTMGQIDSAEESENYQHSTSPIDSVALNEESMPKTLDSHAEDALSDTEEERNRTLVEEQVENLDACSHASDGKDDSHDEMDFGSDINDVDEEAGLRELLELTVIDDAQDDFQEQTDDCHKEIENQGRESPADDILKILGDGEMIDDEVLIDEAIHTPSPDPSKLIGEESEEDDDDLVVYYDSYGRMRGHKSPEQKVADILDAIITGSLPSSEATPSPCLGDLPKASHERDPVKLHGIQQSSLQGSVDSGFHQPDQELLSLTSTPTDNASPKSLENSFSKLEPTKEDTDICLTMPNAQSQETLQDQKVQEQVSSSQSVRPKHPGNKPSVPPKPAKPARPKDLQLKLNAMSSNRRPSNKGPAPQPPQPPPRKRHTAPGIAAKASRFENYSSNAKADGYATLPKSFSPTLESEYDASERTHEPNFDFKSSLSVPDGGSNTVEVKTRKPVARSYTFSDSSPTKDSNKLYPVRKAPPPPLPKPKLTSRHSSHGGETMLKVKESASATNSPHGSISKKSFTGSLSKLLSPSRNRTWGQFKDSLPFKQNNGGSSRLKSKSRKPLKALWPSATCDTPSEGDKSKAIEVNGSNNNDSSQLDVGRFQRSESAEFELNREPAVERRLRSFSLNTRSNSEDSTSESDFDTPTGSPNLRHTGILRGRPSSMIILTDSYPPAFGQPRRPPPPRPSHPPVMKAASLSRLSTKVYESDPIRPIPRTPVEPTPTVTSPTDSTEPTSPPPLPGTKPPDLVSHEQYDLSADDQNEYNHANEDDISFIDAVQCKEYSGVTAICNAIKDISVLVEYMSDCTANLNSRPNVRQFRQAKESLLAEVREFTSNTKMVVSAAGQAGPQLRESTNSSMHTLARLCSATQASMAVMTSPAQAQNLGRKVRIHSTSYGKHTLFPD